ncbi:MAG: phosphoglycerate kinase [Ilumatobacter sp.]|uniref:phosphoglycerate kinase n=1 Tax=Ilumatobacter sp. TaxID=1967498 RepID=UPI00262CE1E5|nr:phosphoglycerate kinase [Ilumatobacter sp.]MDJ0771540.1 phosphoglycerate kinase [Ilumatobacter sp.]
MPRVPKLPSVADTEVGGKRVLLRVDINSPLDPATKRIVDDARIDRSLPTIRHLADRWARLVIIAHQGDALDYHNLVSTEQHAGKLSEKLGRPVQWVDDVAGPEALRRIEALADGEILLLQNIRIHGEELTTFERDVTLTPEQMADTYLVRHLAPLFDLYVNDAFAAAHRRAPSMVGFQRLLPSAAGLLLTAEVDGLSRILDEPARPAVFLLGGLKVSDGFSMMGRVLDEGLADRVLTSGVLGELFLVADGAELGEPTERFIAERDLTRFVDDAKVLLGEHRDRIALPADVAVVEGGERRELPVAALPARSMIVDIGEATISAFEALIATAGTVFVNGPAGAYEQAGADVGTRRLWAAVAAAPGMTAIGGGDTVASAHRFIDVDDVDFVSTAGGALIRFVSGQPLPLLEAFRG